MTNLIRALRLAFRYRWSLVISTACSFAIALTWGSNLAAVYPFIEVIFEGETLAQWIDAKVATVQSQLEAPGLDASDRAGLQRRLGYWQSAAPYLHRYAPATPFGTLLALVAFILSMTVARCLLLGTNIILVTRVSQGVVFELQNKLFRKLLATDPGSMTTEGTGALANRVQNETAAIGSTINSLFGRMIREPLKAATCLVGAAMVNWRLLLISMLVCPLAILVLARINRAIKDSTQKSLAGASKLMSHLVESLTYIGAIQTHNMQSPTRRKVLASTSHLYRQQVRIAWYDSLLRVNNEVLGTGVVCLSLVVGGYLVLNVQTHLWGVRLAAQPMTFGTLVLFYGLLLGTTDPLRKLGGMNVAIRLGAMAADNIYAILDRSSCWIHPPRHLPTPSGTANVKFDGVTFGYRPDQTVLHDVTLEIPAGQRVAIVGANGCGKSTLVSLLPRLYQPRRGRVLLDGRPLDDYSVRDIRRHVTTVSQRAALFDESVRYNIAFGCGRRTDVEILRAAQAAGAMEFINDLPDGLDSPLGEHGANLSGGQRQRLSLARAILRDSPLIILDEATSQVDPESERVIHDKLVPFLQGRTALMITHRASTLVLADRIVVMQEGRIVGDGPLEDLILDCPEFREAWPNLSEDLQQDDDPVKNRSIAA